MAADTLATRKPPAQLNLPDSTNVVKISIIDTYVTLKQTQKHCPVGCLAAGNHQSNKRPGPHVSSFLLQRFTLQHTRARNAYLGPAFRS